MNKVQKTKSGEYVTLDAIEIVSIPDIGILTNEANEKIDFNQKIKSTFAALISRFGFISKALNANQDGCLSDCSFELLWDTQKAGNQPFDAFINVYLVIRAIGFNENQLRIWLEQAMGVCINFFKQHQYNTKKVNLTKLLNILQKTNSRQTISIQKQAYSDDIITQGTQKIFTYDIFSENNKDLSLFSNILSAYPDSIVSFQIIPTSFSVNESNFIDFMNTTLENLSRGMGPMMMSSPTATKNLNTYKVYREAIGLHLFTFNIFVNAPPVAALDIMSGVSELIATSTVGANCRLHREEINNVFNCDNIFVYPWIGAEQLINNFAATLTHEYVHSVKRLPFIITANEASNFFRLPISGNNLLPGFTVNYSSRVGAHTSKKFINSGDIQFGTLKNLGKNDRVGFNLNDINKHMLITGMPGSGKTNFAVGLLNKLWQDHKVPFLIIEPAKTEYRALIDKIPNLQIFTPGKDISPLVINPFAPPRGVQLSTHKSALMTAFRAGIDLGGDHTHLFQEAINKVYADFNWLDYYTISNGAPIPNIDDFRMAYNEVADKIGYEGENRAIKTSGEMRIKSMSTLFDTYKSIPVEDMLLAPTLIELSGIEDEQLKCFITALILVNINTYTANNLKSNEKLKSVILLEEAHVLLAARASKDAQNADASGVAKQLITRMLAEIRAYGLGMIIADQSPEKVSNDVVRMTNIKVTFNIVDATDRQTIANSTNMPLAKQKRLALLGVGEAFLFMNGMEEPEEVKIDHFRKNEKINIYVSDKDIKVRSNYYRVRPQLIKPYPECEHSPYCTRCSTIFKNMAMSIGTRYFMQTQFHEDDTDTLGDSIKCIIKKIPDFMLHVTNLKNPAAQLKICSVIHLLRNFKYDGYKYLDLEDKEALYQPSKEEIIEFIAYATKVLTGGQ